MQYRTHKITLLLGIVLIVVSWPASGLAQERGTLRGAVTLERNDRPIHNARVFLAPPGRTVETGHDGSYEFTDLAPGLYDVVVTLGSLSAQMKSVEVGPGEVATLNFQLRLSPIREQVTVTAAGRQQTVSDAFQSVHSLDTFDLGERAATGIGDVLEDQPGVSKRSFGVGNARPIIRGFDGDRVLILEDGMRVGSLGSTGGDHSEPLDILSMERVEVVKGPATLLYGSNAVGGVVNAISGPHYIHVHPHQGLQGHVTGSAGTNNDFAGGGVAAEYGQDHWLFWGSGGGQRSGDYDTPLGPVDNSKSRIGSGSAGVGWFGDQAFGSVGFRFQSGRYGIPFADQFHDHDGNDHDELEAVDIEFRRNSVRFDGGFRALNRFLDLFRMTFTYTDWKHDEIEIFHDHGPEIGTRFKNQEFTYRGVFEQSSVGPLSGTFGFSGIHRNFEATGFEALAPPVDQNGFAAFALEELRFENFRLQFGGRIEHTRYRPLGPRPFLFERDDDHGHDDHGHAEDQDEILDRRTFTGFSGAAGVHVPLWQGGAFVSNYTHSHRAPSLEELFNLGPHVGNLTFEIGNPNLKRELTNGVDFSLRHLDERVRAQANFFVYGMRDFVFLAPTGDTEHGLIEAEFLQGNARFVGTELGLDIATHPSLWLTLGLDAVDARLTELDQALPRIPPLRGRVGLDIRHNGFSVRPELVMAHAQNSLFEMETRTPGYGVVNLRASYTRPAQHVTHHFGVNVFNVGDRLYRNHSSFIKDLAPEIGRGVRFVYTMRFY